jgi:hypothetical protein
VIVVLPFCQSDIQEFRDWLTWNQQLGGCPAHEALLVADAAVEWHVALDLVDLASKQFSKVSITSNPTPVTGWPHGANSLFLAAARHVAQYVKQPWFWCEPDCIPLTEGWIDAIEKEHAGCGAPYMGALIKAEQPLLNLPNVHLSGCAVYPPDAVNAIGGYCNGSQAWDMASAAAIVPKAKHTPLIHLFWGQPDLAPSFSPTRHSGSAINTFTLADIRKDAVLFHRNKDGTLIRLLRHAKFSPIASTDREFVVVLPFHNGDASMFIKNLEWQVELGSPKKYDCLLSIDASVIRQFRFRTEQLAEHVFRKVDKFEYPTPPNRKWPDAANWAFQHTAHFMQHVVKRPWLWMEYDMIPLTENWLETLQVAYAMCGMPMMGSFIKERGHCNGTAIYPSNFPDLSPSTMSEKTGAFDTTMAKDTASLTFDASHLMQHIWGVTNGQPHKWIGASPSFKTIENVHRWITPGTVTLHRCKDGSLIDRLREMRMVPA